MCLPVCYFSPQFSRHPRTPANFVYNLRVAFCGLSMRFLILSDIHANSTALEAALAAAQGRWESALCLGDVVDYGPDPNEVAERVKPLVSVIIRGNHDKADAGLTDMEDFNPLAQIAARWTREQLRPETMQYIANLPQGPASAGNLTLVHGSYHDEDEYVF